MVSPDAVVLLAVSAAKARRIGAALVIVNVMLDPVAVAAADRTAVVTLVTDEIVVEPGIPVPAMVAPTSLASKSRSPT